MAELLEWSISNPEDLREVTWDSMNDAPKSAEHSHLALKLRIAATAGDSQAAATRRRELAIAQFNPHGALQIVDMVAGGSLAGPKLGAAPQEASREIGRESDRATSGGPRSQMGKVAATAETAEQIQRLEALSGSAIVLRSCELSLK